MSPPEQRRYWAIMVCANQQPHSMRHLAPLVAFDVTKPALRTAGCSGVAEARPGRSGVEVRRHAGLWRRPLHAREP